MHIVFLLAYSVYTCVCVCVCVCCILIATCWICSVWDWLSSRQCDVDGETFWSSSFFFSRNP